MGVLVSIAGEINGDGLDDILVGLVAVASDGVAVSLAGLDLESPEGFALVGAREADNAGQAVAAAGDFNGDGLADLVVGAPGAYFAEPPVPGMA